MSDLVKIHTRLAPSGTNLGLLKSVLADLSYRAESVMKTTDLINFQIKTRLILCQYGPFGQKADISVNLSKNDSEWYNTIVAHPMVI